MKKYLLLCIYFVLFLIVACNKSPGNVPANSTIPNKVFTPVVLFGAHGNWGGGICNSGFIMLRQDTSLTYHSITIPGNAGIANYPTLVNILFHDTVQTSNCWHEIVVDSIKP